MVQVLEAGERSPSFGQKFSNAVKSGLESWGKIKEEYDRKRALKEQGLSEDFSYLPPEVQKAIAQNKFAAPDKLNPLQESQKLLNEEKIRDLQANQKYFEQYFGEGANQPQDMGRSLAGQPPEYADQQALTAGIRGIADNDYERPTIQNQIQNQVYPQGQGQPLGQPQGQGQARRAEGQPSMGLPGTQPAQQPSKPYSDKDVSTWPEQKLRQAAAMANQPGVKGILGQNAKLELEAREKQEKNITEEKRHQSKEVSDSFKENEDYIKTTYDKYEDSIRRDAILGRMDQLNESGELSDSGLYNFFELLGLNPDMIKNPANEEYTKLALDLLGGGTLQADYGVRVLQSEFAVSQKRIPSLSLTQEGRQQIAENIRALLAPAKLKQERMQYYIDKAEREGKPLPHNLRGKVLKDIGPQLDKIADDFKKRNGRYKVQPGTVPDDNALEKYYWLSDGNDEKAFKMMREDGYELNLQD